MNGRIAGVNEQQRHGPAERGGQQPAHHRAQGGIVVADADHRRRGRAATKRGQEEASQGALIEAVDLDALDRQTSLCLEASQAGDDLVCEVGTLDISRTTQTSDDFEGRQRAQPRFPGNLSRTRLARRFGQCPVVVGDAQPVRNPQMPVRLVRKLHDGQAFEKLGGSIPQVSQISSGAVARTVRRSFSFHVSPRTPPPTIARTCVQTRRRRALRGATHARSRARLIASASHNAA